MNKARRNSIQKVIDKLTSLQSFLENVESDVENILDEETECLDNIPENLQSSQRYTQAENACDSPWERHRMIYPT